ncbi:MAG: 50S ribosomal protein L2 [Methanomassiliicoccales archaeon]|nr:MAG: 50S ribosomal protein L2 [Methanomassiliicoccales archaeon]
MGKRIRAQRKGKGGIYSSPSHRFRGQASHPRIKRGTGKVKTIVQDPGRTAPVAKVKYNNNEKGLIIAPVDLRSEQKIEVGEEASLNIGNILPLKRIPEGTNVHNIELKPGDGGKLVRAAGTSAMVVSQGKKTVIRLPSGRFKTLDPKCRASIGIVAGGGHKEKPLAKAGKRHHVYRSKPKRFPIVKGVSMNPVNHPHGGGNHPHVGRPSTVSKHAPPGKKAGRMSSRKGRRKR